MRLPWGPTREQIHHQERAHVFDLAVVDDGHDPRVVDGVDDERFTHEAFALLLVTEPDRVQALDRHRHFARAQRPVNHPHTAGSDDCSEPIGGTVVAL